MREAMDAANGFVGRDWLTFASYRTQLISITLGMFTTLAIYHFISQLIKVTAFPTPEDYFAFLVVGMVIFQVLQSTMGVAGALRGELVAGTFERILLSPFGAVRAIISMMVFPFVMSILTSLILLVLAGIVFGVEFRWSTAALAIPIAAFGTGVFTSFGLLFAATVLVFKRAAGGLGFVVTLITLTSGVYFPVTLLPEWMQWFSDIQPFTAAVDLLRNVLVGVQLEEPVGVELAKMAVWIVLMLPASVAALHLGLRWAQKRGTIVEY
jgi:ABC-2 type transport system permease protein